MTDSKLFKKENHPQNVSPKDNSANNNSSMSYLFKISVNIEEVEDKKLSACDFQASFLFLPTIVFKPNEPSYAVFPMNKKDFTKFHNSALYLSAIHDGHTIGNASVDIAAEFEALEKEYQNFPVSFPVQKSESVVFYKDEEEIGEGYFTLQLFCLGPSTEEASHELELAQAPPYVFKFNFIIEKIAGKKLKSCDLKGKALFLPLVPLSPSACKSVFFAMNKACFAKDMERTICLSADFKGKEISAVTVDITAEFERLKEVYDSCKAPVCIRKKANVTFPTKDISNRSVLGRVNFCLEMHCLGESAVEDLPDKSPNQLMVAEDAETDVEGKYDEYSANVSGHSLVIKLLRGKEEPDECICDGQVKKEGAGKKEEKFVFQMAKGKKENVSSAGKAAAKCGLNPLLDTFGVKIGKKDTSDAAKGRLELDLVAPKKVVDDFKKPMASKFTQTDPEPKIKKGKNKK